MRKEISLIEPEDYFAEFILDNMMECDTAKEWEGVIPINFQQLERSLDELS